MFAVMTLTTTLPWQAYNDPDRKKRYAELARVRPDTDNGRFEAACLTFPEPEFDNLARMAAAEYRFDRVVIEETARLAVEEPEAGLPSKAQQARDIYNLASGAKSDDDKLKAHKLYAELMGYVQKPGITANVQVNNTRVFVMPKEPETPEEIAVWEMETAAQQAKLVSNASR